MSRPARKTLSFALVHFTVAFSVAYLLTGSLAVSGLIALIEPVANTLAYYWHERWWEPADRSAPGATLAASAPYQG